MKKNALIPDPALAILALLATCMGVFFVFDAGYARSLGRDSALIPPEFRSQIIFLPVSILAGVFCSRLSAETWSRASKGLWIVNLVMLLAVMKFGIRMNGAQRWLGYGAFAIQPAEFAKVSAVLYLAATFATRKPWPEKIKRRRDWAHWMDTIAIPKLARAVPGFLILVAAFLIDREKDLGTAGVIAVTAFFMFIPGGVTKKSLIAAVALACFGGYVLVKQEPYRLERIENHVARWRPDNVDDTSYQTVQSELAMASGGVFGVGIGNGRAKQVIPATTTDFVLATVAEEFGLMGAILVILVIGALVYRLFQQALKATDRFCQLTLFGIGAWIGIQACVNVMMANGFLPAIGIPLPFISSGGSSLMALWCAIGIAQSAIAASVTKRSKSLTHAAVQPMSNVGARASRV